MDLYGVRIPTIISENVSIRCAGCGGIIRGTPWRVSLLDIVAPETPPSWSESTALNPGPFQFHSDPNHVLAWMAQRGMLFCRRSQVREIMRPVWLPGEPARLGLCDGIHRDDHEFVALSTEAHHAEAVATSEEAAKAEARALAPQPIEPTATDPPGRAKSSATVDVPDSRAEQPGR